jgi:hypothetical protein
MGQLMDKLNSIVALDRHSSVADLRTTAGSVSTIFIIHVRQNQWSTWSHGQYVLHMVGCADRVCAPSIFHTANMYYQWEN